MKQLDGTGLKRLHREWRRRTERRLALILESVESPFNVGSIVRTAAAYRVDRLWLAGSTASLDSSNVQEDRDGDRALSRHALRAVRRPTRWPQRELTVIP